MNSNTINYFTLERKNLFTQIPKAEEVPVTFR